MLCWFCEPEGYQALLDNTLEDIAYSSPQVYPHLFFRHAYNSLLALGGVEETYIEQNFWATGKLMLEGKIIIERGRFVIPTTSQHTPLCKTLIKNTTTSIRKAVHQRRPLTLSALLDGTHESIVNIHGLQNRLECIFHLINSHSDVQCVGDRLHSFLDTYTPQEVIEWLSFEMLISINNAAKESGDAGYFVTPHQHFDYAFGLRENYAALLKLLEEGMLFESGISYPILTYRTTAIGGGDKV